MSLLPLELDQYLEHLTGPDPALLAEVEAFTHAQFAGGAGMLSGRYQGRVLAFLSKLVRPRRILEIGTFTGYSALCLAEGLAADGELHTLDRDARLAAPVRDFFARSPWAAQMQLHLGPASETLDALPGPFDLVFIDADKKAYGLYLEAVISKCRPGALILIDNVLWRGQVYQDERDGNGEYLALFNEQLARDPRLEAVMLPIRDGVWAVRVR